MTSEDCRPLLRLKLIIFFEGANRGEEKGAGRRIAKELPRSPWFWCSSHDLNNVIVNALKIKEVTNMMDNAQKVRFFLNLENENHLVLRRISGCWFI